MQESTKPADILEVHALPHDRTKGILRCGSITVPCALGRSGIITRKREGDGATPTGTFELLQVYYRADRSQRPQTVLPLEVLKPELGWCDDPGHRRYNRLVDLPFQASHEKMWREDRLYDIVVVSGLQHVPAGQRQGQRHLLPYRPGRLPADGRLCRGLSAAYAAHPVESLSRVPHGGAGIGHSLR